MIRELFFPRTINGKLLFSENVVGIAVDGLMVRVIHTHITRSKIKIVSLDEYAVNPGDPKTYNQRLGAALKKITGKLPKNAVIRANFPSSKVIIKELSVPFLDAEKIRMVVEYEIEPSIPFTLDKALVDFVIIDQSDVKESSTILVAAAQLEEVKKYVDTFKKAGINPHILTVDTFGLADLFGRIPPYDALKTDSAIVNIGPSETRIALMRKQTLIATRTINKGSTPTEEEKQEEHNAALYEEISFTLNSFELKQTEPLSIEKVICVGNNETQESFTAFCAESLRIPCETFVVDKLTKTTGVTSKIALKPNSIGALSIALASTAFAEFTLRQKEVALPVEPIIKRNLFTTAILFVLLFATLGTKGYLEIRDLNTRIASKQKKEIRRLRDLLPSDHKARKKSSPKALIKAAEEHVQEQKDIWAPFANQRLKPTEILQELCMIFNKNKFDLTVHSVLISGEEQEAHPIEVQGLFRAQNGSDHFKQFSGLEQDINDSKTFVLTEEVDPTQAEDGVQFIVRLKQREE